MIEKQKQTTEQLQATLADLKARQLLCERMPCPRCGCDRMNEHPVRNALSRQADIQICDECGLSESIFAMMGSVKPLAEWACFNTEHQ
ncbi:MAG: hypothetical protein RR085_07295 [Clostridia bacterium]